MRTAPPDERSFDTLLDSPPPSRRELLDQERRADRRAAQQRRSGHPLRLTVTAVLALSLLGAGVSYAGERLWGGGDQVTIENAAHRNNGGYGYSGVEVGLKFTVAKPLVADGVFVFVSDPRVSPAVRLWSADGNMIGQGYDRPKSDKGWRKIWLRRPVTLAPGSTFVVSSTVRSAASAGAAAPAAPGVTAVGVVTGRGGQLPARASTLAVPPVQIAVRTATTTPTASPTATPTPSTSPTPTGSSSSTSATSTSTSKADPTPTTEPGSGGPPAGTKGCMAKPSACGYPDATNSGVPDGVSLRAVPGQVSKGTGWHYDSRGYVSVDGNGAVLDGLDIPYNVDVTADNVTIRNSRITVRGDSFGVSIRHADNVVVQHNDISSPNAGDDRLHVGVKDIYADSTRVRVLNNNIWHTQTGIQMDAGLIQGNYIHDMGFKAGDHTNGTTSNAGTQLLTITGNTILNQLDQTDAISLFQDFGKQGNRVIDNNLVAGGGYSIYAGDTPGGSGTTNVKVTNNRFAKLFYARGGAFGYATAFDRGGSGNVWSGNVWDDTGAALGAP